MQNYTDFRDQSTAMPAINSGDAPAPLITSKMGNLQAVAGTLPISGYKVRSSTIFVAILALLLMTKVKA